MSTDLPMQDMLVRDYFAAHAPTEVPDWFKHPDQAEVPELLSNAAALQQVPELAECSQEDKRRLREWMLDPHYDIEQPLMAIGARAFQLKDEVRIEREAAIAFNRAARWFAWRWHYADVMLKARPA